MSLGDVRVKVETSRLTVTLIQNLKAHKEAHQEAVKGWEHEIVKACGLIIASVEEHKLEDLKPIFKHRQRPESHAKEYELVIAMLEYHVGEDIELDQQDFDRYVRDNWEWKEQWALSNIRYSGHR